jgi:hypothetical protein
MTESEQHEWLGQLAGLDVSIVAAGTELTSMHRLAIRHDTTFLGVAGFRRSSGRVTDPSRL